MTTKDSLKSKPFLFWLKSSFKDKIMIKQIVLIITVSAISALTVFGQYFSRVYYDDLRSRRGYSVFPINHVFIVKAFSLHGNIEWVSKIIKIE